MNDYRQLVARLAKERLGEPIVNGSVDHAAIIMEQMFAHAQSRLWILSGGLNARVYGPEETIQQARLFLADQGHRVRILLEMPCTEETLKAHPFFCAFGSYRNIEVRHVPKATQALYKWHFAVMDDDSYRFEKDRENHVAVAAFGDKATASNLVSVYEKLWARSEPVTIPQVEAQH